MIVGWCKDSGGVKSIVERLAADLQNEFPRLRYFSVQHLWCMCRFYAGPREKSGAEAFARPLGRIQAGEGVVYRGLARREECDMRETLPGAGAIRILGSWTDPGDLSIFADWNEVQNRIQTKIQVDTYVNSAKVVVLIN